MNLNRGREEREGGRRGSGDGLMPLWLKDK